MRTGYRAVVTICVAAVSGLIWPTSGCRAAAPRVLHTPGYESPVRGDPDDLLMIAGDGFQPTDRVIYRALDAARPAPRTVPVKNTAEAGIAPILQRGNPP